jgi:hypothetical protein
MTTEERLANLERELERVKRRTRWLVAALGLGLGALALWWVSAASVPKAEAQGAVGGRTVRANAFILEDAAGRKRAGLEMSVGKPELCLYDAAGNIRVALKMFGDDTSMLMLNNAAGSIRAALTLCENKPGLSLFGPAGKGGAHLTPDPNKAGLILVEPVAGKVIWSATTAEERLAKVERELAELREQVRKGAQ